MGNQLHIWIYYCINFQVVSEIYNHVFTDQKWAPSLSLIHFNIEQGEATLSFGNVNIQIQNKSMPQNSLTDNFFVATQMELIEKLAACSYANWLVVLAGPSHVGKKSAIKALAQLNGQKIECLRLTSATDALDLLGSYEQVIDVSPILLNATNKIFKISTTLNDDQIDLYKNLENESTQQGNNIRFEWKDSVFLQAYREGHWLLVEDANCCNSAVLDCLNTCLESVDGQLVLPIDEIRTIKRHPKFR
jgi:midasin